MCVRVCVCGEAYDCGRSIKRILASVGARGVSFAIATPVSTTTYDSAGARSGTAMRDRNLRTAARHSCSDESTTLANVCENTVMGWNLPGSVWCLIR